MAIPHHAYVGVLLYRTDLLHQYGYRAPPKTWDELEAMAARIQAGERARGEAKFWGFVWQGAAGEDLTCAGLEWQLAAGAGRIIEDDTSMSSPRALTILGHSCPPAGGGEPGSIRPSSLKATAGSPRLKAAAAHAGTESERLLRLHTACLALLRFATFCKPVREKRSILSAISNA